MSKRNRKARHGQGEEIMAFRARARRPQPKRRDGRATEKRQAIQEGSR